MSGRRAALAATLTILLAAPVVQARQGYDDYVTGNPADVTTPSTGLLVLQGGGTDVDENFVRMGARSGGGDFVVIRASGSDGLLARLVHDGWTPRARAIAADRETALHVDPADGSAEVFATPTHPTPCVYFLQTAGPPEVCVPETPLTIRGVAVYRIGPGGTFDLDRWRGTQGISYTPSAVAGVLTSSNGSVY